MVNNHEMSAQFGEWVIAKDHPPSIAYVVLSAFAAVVSYLIARLFHLPEAYWAPMSTLIVMKLTLSAALPIAVQYVLGTAVGAAVGAGTDIYFHSTIWSFGAAVALNYSERIASVKGLSFGGKITLRSGMQPAEEFSTLEAEAVAFVVCQSVGLQTGTAKLVQESLEFVQRAASVILGGIAPEEGAAQPPIADCAHPRLVPVEPRLSL